MEKIPSAKQAWLVTLILGTRTQGTTEVYADTEEAAIEGVRKQLIISAKKI